MATTSYSQEVHGNVHDGLMASRIPDHMTRYIEVVLLSVDMI